MGIVVRTDLNTVDILTLCRDPVLGLPNAAGSKFSNDDLHGIVAKTKEQCVVLHDGRDTNWQNSESIRRSALLTAYIHGDKIRKFGGTFRGTHARGVAHRAANFHADRADRFSRTDRGLRAFLGYNHDNPEDGGKNDRDREVIIQLVVACWNGSRALKKSIEKDIRLLSDSLGLPSDEARHAQQIDRAWQMSRSAIVARYCDKLDNTAGDAALVRQGVINVPAEIIARAELARSKVAIVDALPAPVNNADRENYLSDVRYMEAAAQVARREIAYDKLSSIGHEAIRKIDKLATRAASFASFW